MVDTDWNIVVTAHHGEMLNAQKQLQPLIELRKTDFKDVLVGKTEDIIKFLDAVHGLAAPAEGQQFFPTFSRVVPVDRAFEFTIETLPEKLKEAILPYANLVQNGVKWNIVFEWRGFKQTKDSQAAKRIMREWFADLLKSQKKNSPPVMKGADVIIAIETVGPVCGVGFLSRELMAKYPFVRTK